jgi:hypothetical protein
MNVPPPRITYDRQTGQSLVAGIAIWFLHQNTVYPLTSLACKWGWFPFSVAGLPGLKVVQLIISALAVLLLLFVIYLPWRTWRQLQTDNLSIEFQSEKDRRSLVAFVIMLVNGFFLIFSVVTVFTILALNPCA